MPICGVQYYEPIDDLGLYGLDVLDVQANSPFFPGAVKRYVATGDSGQGMTGELVLHTYSVLQNWYCKY